MHHRELDQRSLELHCLMANKVRQDPSLYLKIGKTLERWKRIVSEDSLPLILEWEKLYKTSLDACLAVATENSERANQLRQASPFCGILTPKERTQFFQSWKASRS